LIIEVWLDNGPEGNVGEEDQGVAGYLGNAGRARKSVYLFVVRKLLSFHLV
jgi:hypothetical protein